MKRELIANALFWLMFGCIVAVYIFVWFAFINLTWSFLWVLAPLVFMIVCFWLIKKYYRDIFIQEVKEETGQTF